MEHPREDTAHARCPSTKEHETCDTDSSEREAATKVLTMLEHVIRQREEEFEGGHIGHTGGAGHGHGGPGL